MVTIKMIAERCGLSAAAVSRALNHQSGVGAERAERVRQIAKERGYYPNAAARELKTSRSNVMPLETPYPGGTTISTDNVGAMQEIVRHLHAKGHHRIAFIHGEDCQVTQERLAGFFRGRIYDCFDACGVTCTR